MKIFQILGGFCHWDATETVRSIDRCPEMFSADMVFAEAPDHVFEGWGYDDTLTGDERFIKPVPPEGWLYDETTGAFYEEGTNAPFEMRKSPEQLAAENAELRKSVAELEAQLIETQLALCELYENTIAVK